MQLYEVEAGVADPDRGTAKAFPDCGEIVVRQAIAIVVEVCVQALHRRLASLGPHQAGHFGRVVLLVEELRGSERAFGVDVVYELPQPRHEAVLVGVGCRCEAGLDGDVADHDQRRPAAGDPAIERARAWRDPALRLVARRHRREDDAVAKRERPETNRLEEQATGHPAKIIIRAGVPIEPGRALA